VKLNNFEENVLLRDASTFYQKLNDYCVRVEQEQEWNETNEILEKKYPLGS
jgi:hypothetical protein